MRRVRIRWNDLIAFVIWHVTALLLAFEAALAIKNRDLGSALILVVLCVAMPVLYRATDRSHG